MEMSMIYLVFHISMLRKHMDDPKSRVPLEGVNIEENLT